MPLKSLPGTAEEIGHLHPENARLRHRIEEPLTQAPGHGPETADKTLPPSEADGGGAHLLKNEERG